MLISVRDLVVAPADPKISEVAGLVKALLTRSKKFMSRNKSKELLVSWASKDFMDSFTTQNLQSALATIRIYHSDGGRIVFFVLMAFPWGSLA